MANKILTPTTFASAAERAAPPSVHHTPRGFSDHFALGFTKLLRFRADTFFAKRYGHRARAGLLASRSAGRHRPKGGPRL